MHETSAFQNFAAQLVVDNQIILFCKKWLGTKSNERLTEQVVIDLQVNSTPRESVKC